MQAPLEVTFRGMPPSPAVEASIQRWMKRIENDYDQIQHCAVVIEQPHRQHRQGNRFHVRLEMRVPGRDIAVARDPDQDGRHEDVYVAIGDAFRAARRQLQDHAQIRQAKR